MRFLSHLDDSDQDVHFGISVRSERENVEVRDGHIDPHFTSDNKKGEVLMRTTQIIKLKERVSLIGLLGNWVLLLIRLRIESRMPLWSL